MTNSSAERVPQNPTCKGICPDCVKGFTFVGPINDETKLADSNTGLILKDSTGGETKGLAVPSIPSNKIGQVISSISTEVIKRAGERVEQCTGMRSSTCPALDETVMKPFISKLVEAQLRAPELDEFEQFGTSNPILGSQGLDERTQQATVGLHEPFPTVDNSKGGVRFY